MTDDLGAPLKKKKRGLPLPDIAWRRLPVTRIAVAIIVLGILVFAGRIMLVDDPLGGRPSAEVAVNSQRNNNPIANQVSDPQSADNATAEATPAQTENQSGPAIITLDEDVAANAESQQFMESAKPTGFGADPDLLEETPSGSIPRISGTGETPFETYARASITPAAANGKALISIVVTGLGLNETSSSDAIGRLPAEVSLAFAPYGKLVERLAGSARAEGHELLLEIPLEPYDYPDNDPGPQTLLTGKPPRTNLENLFWLMSRFGGYVGVINYMGARFTASAADFGPIMEELGTRGLGYLDDGSSNRSVAAQLATTNNVPFARATLTLDTNPSRDAINDELDRLVATARQKGSAVGVVSALPVSIQAIVDWAGGLEDDSDILLVPVSALMAPTE